MKPKPFELAPYAFAARDRRLAGIRNARGAPVGTAGSTGSARLPETACDRHCNCGEAVAVAGPTPLLAIDWPARARLLAPQSPAPSSRSGKAPTVPAASPPRRSTPLMARAGVLAKSGPSTAALARSAATSRVRQPPIGAPWHLRPFGGTCTADDAPNDTALSRTSASLPRPADDDLSRSTCSGGVAVPSWLAKALRLGVQNAIAEWPPVTNPSTDPRVGERWRGSANPQANNDVAELGFYALRQSREWRDIITRHVRVAVYGPDDSPLPTPREVPHGLSIDGWVAWAMRSTADYIAWAQFDYATCDVETGAMAYRTFPAGESLFYGVHYPPRPSDIRPFSEMIVSYCHGASGRASSSAGVWGLPDERNPYRADCTLGRWECCGRFQTDEVEVGPRVPHWWAMVHVIENGPYPEGVRRPLLGSSIRDVEAWNAWVWSADFRALVAARCAFARCDPGQLNADYWRCAYDWWRLVTITLSPAECWELLRVRCGEHDPRELVTQVMFAPPTPMVPRFCYVSDIFAPNCCTAWCYRHGTCDDPRAPPPSPQPRRCPSSTV